MTASANKELVRRFYREAGRRVEFTSTVILRIRDGLVAEAWDEMVSGAILARLEAGDG